jgi:DNA invertase Pin-like site-specific DNA recombinase
MIVDGYIRVSVVGGRAAKGERFISPVLQREQIEGWAKLNGAFVARVFEELDESGARSDRPLFLRSIERVEAGESDGVVVAKLDRFARSLLDALLAIERIQSAGGTFVSVQDGLDLGTDTGKFVVRIMLSMAEWELDRIRTTWNVARERAIARGMYLGPAPAGYVKRDGQLCVDPQTGPVIAEAFRRRAGRASVRQVGLFLEASGVLTGAGRPGWANQTVRKLLANRAYLGEARSGAYVKERSHEPLVDHTTWQLVHGPHELPEPRPDARPGLLTGLLRCAACRRRLATVLLREPGGRRQRRYFCRGAYPDGICPAPTAISSSLIEPYIEAVFWQELRRRRPRPPEKELAALRARAEQAERTLLAYRDNPRIIEAIGAERFVEGLRRRLRRAEFARVEVSAAQSRLDRPGPASAPDIGRRWQSMSVAERRAAIGEVIDCAFVARGEHRTAARTSVCLRGEAPLELPGHANRVEIEPFDPAECRGRSPVELRCGRKRWPEARVRRELERFAGSRDYFPTCEEFSVAGRLSLFEQVKLQGGRRRWAEEIGIKHLPRDRNMPNWDDERIRVDLAGFLTGKTYWPTVAQFKAAGRSRVRQALNEHGGAERWAREFGLKFPGTVRGGRLYWTPERMDIALSGFVRGRTSWPTQKEFRASGLSGLDGAMARRGGVRYWARRIGFTRDTGKRIMTRQTPYEPPTTLPTDTRPWVRPIKQRSIALWTDEAITQAIQHWTDDHGRTPRSADWSPNISRCVDDYYAGPYPPMSQVVRTFGSWRAGLRAAGFDASWHGFTPAVVVRGDAPVPRFPPTLPQARRGCTPSST